jgi:hypothetical protein
MLDGKEASSNRSASETPNPDGVQESWWLENKETCPPFDSPRSKAYLRAYIESAGPMFYGSGIPLDRGLMHSCRGYQRLHEARHTKTPALSLRVRRSGCWNTPPEWRGRAAGNPVARLLGALTLRFSADPHTDRRRARRNARGSPCLRPGSRKSRNSPLSISGGSL